MKHGVQRIWNGLRWRAEAVRDALSSVAAKVRISLFGPYWCSVCGQQVLKFNPLSPSYFQNFNKYGRTPNHGVGETCNINAYSCPKCGDSDRARLYALYLTPWLLSRGHDAETRLLDFAPSRPLTNLILDTIKQNNLNVRYVTADLLKAGVDVTADICDMPIFQTESVDFFICSHILEHVQDDQKALSELCRILKPGAKGILMVPINLKASTIDEDPSLTDIGERWRRFGQDDHVREYCRKGFLERARGAGFIVHEYGASHFGWRVFWRHGISLRSVLYVVEKPRTT